MTRALVIALHCSGAGASQWRRLAETLGPDCELVAPEHYGCDGTGPWTGRHAFTLADEAARTIALIDDSERKVHLVGIPMAAASHCMSRWRERSGSQAFRSTSPRRSTCSDSSARVQRRPSPKSAPSRT